MRLILGQGPWRCLINILVASSENVEDLRHGIGHSQLFHLGIRFFHLFQNNTLKILIHRLCSAPISDHAVKILVAHGNGAVHQIAQDIGQVGVHALHHQLP